MLARAAGSASLGWNVRPGRAAAKWTACSPDPLATSSTSPAAGRRWRSTARMASRLRDAAGGELAMVGHGFPPRMKGRGGIAGGRQGQASALDPPKAGGLWKPLFFLWRRPSARRSDKREDLKTPFGSAMPPAPPRTTPPRTVAAAWPRMRHSTAASPPPVGIQVRRVHGMDDGRDIRLEHEKTAVPVLAAIDREIVEPDHVAQPCEGGSVAGRRNPYRIRPWPGPPPRAWPHSPPSRH